MPGEIKKTNIAKKFPATPDKVGDGALAGSPVKEREKPKMLLAALNRLRSVAEDTNDSPIIYFSRAANGNVLLTVKSKGSEVASEELPLPAPTSCTSEYPGYDKSLYKQVMPPIVLRETWSLPADAPDDCPPELVAPPFRFAVNLTSLMDFLKRCDGDPFIVATAGGEGAIRMYQTDHGQLNIERDDIQLILKARANKTRS